MARFGSEEWFRAYCDAINASSEHRQAAKTWEGDVCFVIEPDHELGIDEEVWAHLDLHHGECRKVEIVPIDVGERARFVIRGPYTRWKEVIEGDLPPLRAMREGKLRLAGDLHAIAEHAEAADLLVQLAGSIPTEFGDA